MKDFMTFRKMISTTAIQIIFWLSVLIWVIVGLKVMTLSSTAYSNGYYGSRYSSSSGNYPLLGFLIIVFGILISRIECEFLIVIFRINDTLTDIRNKDHGTQFGY